MTSEIAAPRDSEKAGPRLLDKLKSLPLGVKFAAAVVATIGILALAIGFGLSRFATQHLVQAKLRGSEVVVDSVAETLVPALDFADETGITECAERLSRTRDVSRVIVWNQDLTRPVFRKPAETEARAPQRSEERANGSEIVLTRLLQNPLGQQVGRLEVAFSLRSEERYSRHLSSRILGMACLLALVVAGLIIVIARYGIVLRLEKLLAAMVQLRNGRQVAVDATTADEIGELAHGFNEMAHAIRDREQKLSIERDKSHELLDNMRQAILVIDERGKITDVRSRQAEAIFGSHLHEQQIWELLCDESRPAVEREALREWIGAAFALGPAQWADLSELAPTEAVVQGRDNQTHVLTLDARPIVLEGQLARVMFLCTDVTAQREFERAARAREEEHDRQMRVMRTLVAGGGLQLVATVRNIEERIAACERIICADATETAINELFQLVHSIKGDASAFELELLVRMSSAMEAELANCRMELQHGLYPAGDGATCIREGLAGITNALTETRAMIGAASPLGAEILDLVAVRRSDLLSLRSACANSSREIRDAVSRTLAQHFGPLVQNLASACERWAARLSKKAVLEIRGHNVLVPDDLARVLPGVLTQLIRNAVSHGIEKPEERVCAGKLETGRIEVTCTNVGGRIEFHVIDDGRGLDESRLAPQLGALGGEVSASEAVFLAGVSTADDVAIQAGIAGRGVGLGSVRAQLSKVSYDVQLKSVPVQGLDVHLFPLANMEPRGQR